MIDFQEIFKSYAMRDNRKEGDYEKDGYLMCGKCHTKKQYEVKGYKVPIPCKCRQAEIIAERECIERERQTNYITQLQNNIPHEYRKYTFENDDNSNSSISIACKKYVDKWDEMKSNNIGILFIGTVGTGKTYMACAIANALVGKGVSVKITSIPRLLNKLQNTDDKREYINELKQYELLVVDDLGAERGTSYAVEQVYSVVDARLNKPLIVTTNLTLDEMQNAQEIQYKRIYERVLEACPIKISITGQSKRIKITDERLKKAKDILKS